MHRTSTAQSPVRTTQAQAQSMTAKIPLHPVLQQALASLDTQLEAELLRYRRQRTLGRGSYTPHALGQRPVKATLPARSDGADSSAPPASFHPTATVPPFVAIANPTDSTLVEPAALELKELAKQYASEVAAVSDQTVTGGPEDYLESSEELLRTLSQEQAQVAAEQSFLQSLLTPLGLGSMLLLLMTSALFGFVIMNPNSVSQLLHRSQSIANNSTQPSQTDGGIDATSPQPNLASQEFPELTLGNLGAIPAETSGSGLTPGGLPVPAIAKPGGKTAHLGASGITSGALPTGVPAVPSTPQLSAPAANSATSPRVPTSSPSAPAPSVDLPPASAYVPPARSYSPPPARSYTPSPRRSSPPVKPYTPPARSVLPAPKPIPVPVPNLDRTPPPPAPAPTASASPNASGYKVVTPYTSDQTLEEYRGKVPDAYVKNYSDGAKVQFGAYGDENSAQSQAEELRKQGIPAEVYKP